jgi:hypothetical protein
LQTSDYSFGERFLHRLALGMPLVTKASFEFDGLLFSNHSQSYQNEKHVFVSGLARAGTTILMRTLYETGQFRSLTYRDMPFVLMPGMWNKLSSFSHKHGDVKERAHGDGIYVDFDSPEAFEELFWRTFSGNEYIFDNCLQPHKVSHELIEQFRLYIRRIIDSSSNSNQRRYLSKNNNNILRLGAIRQAFPKSLIIIPFRDPVQQANSLLNQHRKFCARHAMDKFSYDYMRWLGHHEFGRTHKPFRFDKEDGFSLSDYKVDNINYWLNVWIGTYRYLLNSASDSIFVCFEDLCKSPADTLRSLFKSADLLFDGDRLSKVFNSPRINDVDGLNESLIDQAQIIYQDLRALALVRY